MLIVLRITISSREDTLILAKPARLHLVHLLHSLQVYYIAKPARLHLVHLLHSLQVYYMAQAGREQVGETNLTYGARLHY